MSKCTHFLSIDFSESFEQKTKLLVFKIFFRTEAELDFVSGVSEAEMTDTEMFKPVVGRRLIKTKSGESDNDSTGTIEAKNNEMATKIMFATGTQPKFERFPPKQIKLVEGGSIRLDCVISGKPPPLVTWSHKGVMVKNGYRFKIIEDKENGERLSKIVWF